MIILVAVLSAVLGGSIGAFFVWWKSPGLLAVRMQEFALKETIRASEEIVVTEMNRANHWEAQAIAFEEDMKKEIDVNRDLRSRLDLALAELGSAAKNIQTLGGSVPPSAVRA